MHAGSKIIDMTPHLDVEVKQEQCGDCVRSKFTKRVVNVDPNLKVVPTRPNQVKQLDFLIAGVDAIGGIRMALIQVDAYSRLIECLLCKDKKFETFKQALEDRYQSETYPETLVVDRDGPFVSEQMQNWCLEVGIKLKAVPTARHEFNGLVENSIKTLQNWTLAGLLDSQLPKTYWSYALMNAVKLRNRLAHSALDWRIPYEVHYMRPVRVKNLSGKREKEVSKEILFLRSVRTR